jgi:hypothetical protein
MPFIVGAGRSGTTLLRLMLDSHSQLAIPSESGFLAELSDPPEPESAGTPAGFLEIVLANPHWAGFCVPDAELRAAVGALDPFDSSAAARLCYSLYAARHDKPRYGDKTPMYVLKMDQLERLLPEARFVHIIRDGRDVALSMRPMPFAPGKDMTSIAAQWRDWVRQGRELGPQVNHYMEVRFEDLVRDPKAELRAICEFIELEFELGMLDYTDTAHDRLKEPGHFNDPISGLTATPDSRVRSHEFTALPPQSSRIGRWRSEMTAAELGEFEAEAGELLDELGYGVAYEDKNDAKKLPKAFAAARKKLRLRD